MMLSQQTPLKNHPRLRRCFISAQSGEASEALARILAARGVECLRADDITPGSHITPEIFRHLEAADFVSALVDEEGATAPNVFFELGAAHVLQKPILLFTTNYDQLLSALQGVYVIKATLDDLPSVSAEIDRFLRHAKPLSPPSGAPAEALQKPNLSWAREQLTALRSERSTDRGLRFEHFVTEVFRRAGGEVVAAEHPAGGGSADLLVWLDEVSHQVGGPLIVACQYYGGGSGSVLMNAKHTVEHLEKMVTGTDAGLALLVYDHDRPRPPSPLFETPRVLAFPIEQLIQALEGGTLAEEVVRRRERAGHARVSAGGSH